jgi:hypothetical protein
VLTSIAEAAGMIGTSNAVTTTSLAGSGGTMEAKDGGR